MGDGETAYSPSGYEITPLSEERVDELAKGLSAEDAEIILRKGTEPAFCGLMHDHKEAGVYLCKLCGLPLFASDSKFTSGSGWPSFFKPFDDKHVAYEEDSSFGMKRVEILCTRCSGHLGHVFDDGPRPTGLRYCVNSASLDFVPSGTELPERSKPITTETAYFAGGCFWGVEDRFQVVPGVIDAASGYQGGSTEEPTYKQVCSGTTGHTETVRVIFDPTKVTFEKLLEKFFEIHDPTQLNRQGPDFGTQYRSAIFTVDEKQQAIALKFVAGQAENPRFEDRAIVTEIKPVTEAGPFYIAEEFHQDYHLKHGGSCALPSR